MANQSKLFFLGLPGGAAPVTSVFGRIGAVVAVAGDYLASQITNNSVVPGAFVSDALDTLAAAIPPPAAVTSVFGRIGAVVAVANDYLASQVDNDSGVAGASVADALDTLAAVSGVTSVFGRVGAVVAVANDYLASQVDNDSSVAGASVADALDTLAAVSGVTSVFGRVGAVVAVANDYTDAQVDNTSNVDGAVGDVQSALNTVYAGLPNNRLNILRPILASFGTPITPTSGNAYFQYVGPISVAKLFQFVEFYVSTVGTGAQTAEVALASTPTAPNDNDQDLTVLVADGALDSLTVGTGVKRNTAGFNAGAGYTVTPAAGGVIHLWTGLREAMAATQAACIGIALDANQGYGLIVAGAAALAAGQVLAGVRPAPTAVGNVFAWARVG